MQYANVKIIVYFVHSFILPHKKRVCNKMKILQPPSSLKIMVLYKNESIAS
jgi:hypothetical protein